ncbi:MAG: tetratricopeptide repeat protein [Flavobacteriales bacterium]|nr:tetratricopeptide repeat protein [Flavobacteriales bacterium]
MKQLVLVISFALVCTLTYSQTAEESFKTGLTQLESKNYAEAIDAFNKAIAGDKENTTYLLKRGEAKYGSGKGILAIQDFNKVIQLDEANSAAYALRSAIYVDMKDYKSAIEDCKKAIELDPKNELAYVRMGDAYFFQQPADYIEAMKSYNYAININEKNKTALHNRGFAKRELKDYYGAIDDFNKAILIDAEYGSAYMNRGVCKSLVGDNAGACIDWYLAGEMGQAEANDYIQSRCNQ